RSASTPDQTGPFGTSVRDAAICLDAISGPDPNDSTAATTEPPRFEAALTGEIAGLRVGVPRSWLKAGVDRDVSARFEESLASLERLGATVHDIELPHSRVDIPVYYLVATAAASANLARDDV